MGLLSRIRHGEQSSDEKDARSGDGVHALQEDERGDEPVQHAAPRARVPAVAESGAAGADGPTDLDKQGWWSATRSTVREIGDDNLTTWAAALTYYAVLAIFPAILALVSMLGVIGPSATQPLIDNLATAAPGQARDIVTSAIENIQQNRGTSTILFIAGLAGALWAASGYVSSFMTAANAVYDVDEMRPLWKRLPLRLAVTTLLLVLLAVSAMAVVLTGGLAERVGDLFGVGGTAIDAWDIAKWPVLVGVVSFMFALLYWAAPDVRHPGFRWITPGSITAVVLWMAASAAFAFYVANFGSYNKTYGSLGGVVVFLVWLWISNLALLIGAELNSELELRAAAQSAGATPASTEKKALDPEQTRTRDVHPSTRDSDAHDSQNVGPEAADRDTSTTRPGRRTL